ncbi:MAG: NAD(+)/NADH kinase, partial [Bacteroidales bacterium]|nr:NAD(+)/NADH kinase [Bacteroidales bacterium]
MKIAIYVDERLRSDSRYLELARKLLSAGFNTYDVRESSDIQAGTDIVISVGGDGTFLSAAKRVGDTEIPILGVNLGRLGFLSENNVDDAVQALVKGEYMLENRALLKADVSGTVVSGSDCFSPYALNEISVHRVGAAMLGVDVCIDGDPLPTYWADGLLVATSSGSTAYSLSVGGPICSPQSRVLIIAPIAPHNLNVRPLIVPDTTSITISVQSRDKDVMLTMDNRNITVRPDVKLDIAMAQ